MKSLNKHWPELMLWLVFFIPLWTSSYRMDFTPSMSIYYSTILYFFFIFPVYSFFFVHSYLLFSFDFVHSKFIRIAINHSYLVIQLIAVAHVLLLVFFFCRPARGIDLNVECWKRRMRVPKNASNIFRRWREHWFGSGYFFLHFLFFSDTKWIFVLISYIFFLYSFSLFYLLKNFLCDKSTCSSRMKHNDDMQENSSIFFLSLRTHFGFMHSHIHTYLTYKG